MLRRRALQLKKDDNFYLIKNGILLNNTIVPNIVPYEERKPNFPTQGTPSVYYNQRVTYTSTDQNGNTSTRVKTVSQNITLPYCVFSEKPKNDTTVARASLYIRNDYLMQCINDGYITINIRYELAWSPLNSSLKWTRSGSSSSYYYAQIISWQENDGKDQKIKDHSITSTAREESSPELFSMSIGEFCQNWSDAFRWNEIVFNFISTYSASSTNPIVFAVYDVYLSK